MGIGGIKLLDTLIKRARSVRKFKQNAVSMETLEEIASVARYSAATRNLQVLRYLLVADKEVVDKIFPETNWAGYIEWNPCKTEKPTAYIIICRDKDLSITDNLYHFDMGVAAQNMILKANELGYGTCILGAFSKEKITEIVELDKQYEVGVMIALGDPDEECRIVDLKAGDIRYYRDEKGVHCVPKRKLEELIVKKI